MENDRINPVALITGAASAIGTACARQLARRADGGLILVDLDAASLDAAADTLERAPERVSTLAFDVGDALRWAQAADFIRAQYGRLDWAVIDAASFDSARLALRTLTRVMLANIQGGAIVLTAATAKESLLPLVRDAAREGAPNSLRVNAVLSGGAGGVGRDAPLFQDLVRECGSERAAFEAIAQLATPLARYEGGDDLPRLAMMLLSGGVQVTGATLVVDGGYTI